MNENAKMLWQCRRGSLELDLLLKNYLETDFLTATAEEKTEFVDLLTLEDDALMDVMIKKSHKQAI